MKVFLSPAARERLKQGEKETVIAGLLACEDVGAVRAFLTEACLADPSVVEVINRYLKTIVVKRISMADFKPALSTIERGQIPEVVSEFREYLEKEIDSIDDSDDTLPMLQLE